jgi:ankyrin repeat protein
MHSFSRTARFLFLASALLTAPAEAARLSSACTALTQKAAALSREDTFQANLLLFPAAAAGCEDLVRDLLALGIAVEARDRLGKTALSHAAQEGRNAVVDMLLDRGASIDSRAISGATPLFFATEADRAATSKLLLARGADVGIPGPGGLTPLMAAAFNGNAELVDLFLAKGADPNALETSGKAAIIYAASRGFTNVVARLIDAGADVNRRYEHRLTAAMWAAGYADGAGVDDIKQVLALLIARGAALDARDDRGFSAQEIARDLGHTEIADFLASQSPAR